MPGRPHGDRLLKELTVIRAELAEEVQRLTPEELDWAPRPDMKSFKALLLEIGWMEKFYTSWLLRQEVIDWDQTAVSLVRDPAAVFEALMQVREETLSYLRACTEEQLQTPVQLPAECPPGEGPEYWEPPVEPAEVIRWIARHEYYHLGQIITYRWLLGDNPYQRS
jgi:uncharacterized damage-inducible protein DinB